jgi:hypothetical protein
VRLIDSTGLRLAGVGAEWARFSTDVFGAKAHVVSDPDLGRPVYHAVTAANVNDITAAKERPIEAGATYVFDLGYYDFGFWAKLDALGCRLVTRFKTNTPLNEPREMPLEPGSTVLSDRIGFLPARQGNNRKNPMPDVGSAKSSSRPKPARRCAFSPTTSTLPPRRSPISTSAAGGSNCSSA